MTTRKVNRRKVSKKSAKKPSVVQLLLFLGCLLLVLTTGITFFHIQSPLPCGNSISCTHDLMGKPLPDKISGIWLNKPVTAPADVIAQLLIPPHTLAVSNVLGITNTNPNKRIYVDLSAQRLYAFEGTSLIYNFLISSGLWNKTPTGTFHIAVKLQATHMQGGNPALGDYYDLYNVPWTMYFGNDQIPWSLGYSTHGKYWNNTYGQPSSHGCINMQIADAKQLYDWADPQTQGYTTYATTTNPGTEIVIYGTYISPQH